MIYSGDTRLLLINFSTHIDPVTSNGTFFGNISNLGGFLFRFDESVAPNAMFSSKGIVLCSVRDIRGTLSNSQSTREKTYKENSPTLAPKGRDNFLKNFHCYIFLPFHQIPFTIFRHNSDTNCGKFQHFDGHLLNTPRPSLAQIVHLDVNGA